jgi:protein-S-isoprenylcysteine O-methyltransferase Ste14
MNPSERRSVVRQAVIKVAAAWILLPLFFLATGGDLAWWNAWAYCAILLAPMTAFIAYQLRHDPDFIVRRSTMREKEKTQRWVLVIGTPLWLASFVIPGLDHRFGWSSPSGGVAVAGLVAVLASYLGILWVFLENRWAGRTVETFDGQKVISTGPYAVVRHPMYACACVLYVATPVALGSWWAVPPALAFTLIFIPRILNEEAVLVRELAGYDEYRSRVRYRLMPFVW